MRKRHLLPIICGLAALMLTSCGKEPPVINFGGSWNSAQWGAMRVVQTGDHVAGTYEYQDGRIEGTVSENKLTFSWWQNVPPGASFDAAGKKDRGNGYLILANNKNSFEGQWRFDGDTQWRDVWSALRKKGN
jgi:hypothetical protein